MGNAGSFFQNPIIPINNYEQIKKEYPSIPGWPVNDTIKISAAWPIEQLGFKGYRHGHVGVYEKHALVLVNYGEGSGEELVELAKKIQRNVKNVFNISLIPEVNIIGNKI